MDVQTPVYKGWVDSISGNVISIPGINFNSSICHSAITNSAEGSLAIIATNGEIKEKWPLLPPIQIFKSFQTDQAK